MKKCKFYKKCPLYAEDSFTCNENNGEYYEDRKSSCYLLMEKKNE